jgi:hypothetical protein
MWECVCISLHSFHVSIFHLIWYLIYNYKHGVCASVHFLLFFSFTSHLLGKKWLNEWMVQWATIKAVCPLLLFSFTSHILGKKGLNLIYNYSSGVHASVHLLLFFSFTSHVLGKKGLNEWMVQWAAVRVVCLLLFFSFTSHILGKKGLNEWMNE